ncbi:hypothetical protein M0M57_00465 [Flavobacterium azooxidireducens]|uniref:Acyltransferase n=1 Tax=Flavobacterium azooxidireducens TaxID=1871076 RepID=A0ABY4KIR6_9FLAO|nr:hypothetical protein [Flavobacterium azooxidireducens]UPQ79327.1 hypothetical protein M0M57_00465 [Flavobacterium azooxidireducens]
MNLSYYVKKRNGVPIWHSYSLRNNLHRSLGAKNFSTFWNFWNPIFGYYLGSKIFKPLKKVIPIGFAVVFTFIFCGFIHDLVTTLLRGKLSLFFSLWFLLMGTVVAFSKYIHYDLSNKKWIFRAFVNLSIIGICLLLTNYLNTIFRFY